jgi:multidrug efflux pump subunit AcrA (membrane-fusion protein)
VVWRVASGLSVPALAVSWVGGQPFVFVTQASGGRTVVKQRPVRLGELGDRSYPVLSGLEPGERIATSGVQKLRDGAPIVAEAAAPAAAPAAGKG